MPKEKPVQQGVLAFGSGEYAYILYKLSGASLSDFFLARSNDGMHFKTLSTTVSLKTLRGAKGNMDQCADFRSGIFHDGSRISFLKKTKRLALAALIKETDWQVVAETAHFRHPTVFYQRSEKESVWAFSGSGKKYIFLASGSEQGKRWEDHGVALEARPDRFDAYALAPLMVTKVKQGLLLLYTAKDSGGTVTAGAALFDPKDPKCLRWRSDTPLWEASLEGGSERWNVLGGARLKKYVYLYCQREDGGIDTTVLPRLWESYVRTVREHAEQYPERAALKLIRFEGNPVIEPNAENEWESFAAFNPAAVYVDGIVHLLYRAMGAQGLSVLGYATSRDGLSFSRQSALPAYVPRETFEGGVGVIDRSKVNTSYMSAGGYGGCEDPKLTVIDDRAYLTYVAFDGWRPPRIALSWIPIADFLMQRWEKWSAPVLISPVGTVDKSAAILPEKVNGKYVIFHRIFPNILIDFVDSLEDFDGSKTFLRGEYKIGPRPGFWDWGKLSVGAPPMKTRRGWLVIYHAVSGLIERGGDLRYKMGAMLLDLHDPRKVLARSRGPILEPETEYENGGHKYGVVYPCGAIEKDGILFVYYGASDKTVAVATAALDEFLDQLLNDQAPRLKPIAFQKEK